MTGRLETLEDLLDDDLSRIALGLTNELEELEGRSLLITGAGDFLGYYLVQAALHWNAYCARDPIQVTAVDDFRRGLPPWLEELREDSNLALLEHDLAAPLPPGLPPFDYAIHAAGVASPGWVESYPIEAMEANVAGLRHLLEQARSSLLTRRPVRGLLYFSGARADQEPRAQGAPLADEGRASVASGPDACYADSTRYGEALCVSFARQHGVPAVIARPFDNYGPGLALGDRRTISELSREVLRGRDLVVAPDLSPRRAFCYAADAITGYYKALLKGRPGEPYNIGVERPEVSVVELAERLAALGRELFGYQGRVVKRPAQAEPPPGDQPQPRSPRLEKARRELGYLPGMALDEGLRRTLVWFGHRRDLPEA